MQHAFALNWITPRERQPPLDARRQGRLTPRRRSKTVDINRRVAARAAGEVAHVDG
jgi:hypothetical protein